MGGEVQKNVHDRLGPDMLGIIRTASKGASYRLFFGEGEAVDTLAGYKVEAEGRRLQGEEIATLQAVIEDDETYEFELTARVPFLPGYGFRLSGESGDVVLLVDPDRNKLRLLYEEQKLISDTRPHSPGVAKLNALIEEVFHAEGGER